MAAISLSTIHEDLLRTNVNWFSEKILGIPYPKLQRIIYPQPAYNIFAIKKRNGSARIIAEPTSRLKSIQECVLKFLQDRSKPFRPVVHGFVPKRSIVSNAQAHCSRNTHHLLNLDLEDFFPSISFYRIRGVLQNYPFKFSHEVATVIAHICTLDNALPQGAPTSPFLSNLVCRSLDRDLAELARRNRAIYTRYADDITFSFRIKNASRLPTAICVVDGSGAVTIGAQLHGLITSKHSFSINEEKTRLSDRFRRMEVTGLTINDAPNVPRIFIDRIRGALNAWERNGYSAAQKGWEQRIASTETGPY